ncbi:hypothetical protein BDW71DRAFT_179569 [Aspergillus fruticulosus]
MSKIVSFLPVARSQKAAIFPLGICIRADVAELEMEPIWMQTPAPLSLLILSRGRCVCSRAALKLFLLTTSLLAANEWLGLLRFAGLIPCYLRRRLNQENYCRPLTMWDGEGTWPMLEWMLSLVEPGVWSTRSPQHRAVVTLHPSHILVSVPPSQAADRRRCGGVVVG